MKLKLHDCNILFFCQRCLNFIDLNLLSRSYLNHNFRLTSIAIFNKFISIKIYPSNCEKKLCTSDYKRPTLGEHFSEMCVSAFSDTSWFNSSSLITVSVRTAKLFSCLSGLTFHYHKNTLLFCLFIRGK